jgi:hypothetical protein|tara:strand:- start:54 stop:1679 length:1626 start_codon:yes stop_codon:yes gene_type:complete
MVLFRQPQSNFLNKLLRIENQVAPSTLARMLGQKQEPFMTQVENQPQGRTGIFGPEQPPADLNEVLKRSLPNTPLEDLGILGKAGEIAKRGVRGGFGDTANIVSEFAKPSNVLLRKGIGAAGAVIKGGEGFAKGAATQAKPFKLGMSGGKPKKFVPIVQKKTSVIPVNRAQKAEEALITSQANKTANLGLPEDQKQILVTTKRTQDFITAQNVKMIQGWDKKAGKFGNKIEDTIQKQLIGNPAFEALSLPDKASVIGLVERPVRELTFPEIQKITSNTKMKSPFDPKTGKPAKDSFIREVDTVKGCGNNCAECYAAGLCSQQQVTFQDPVPATIDKGEVLNPKNLLRIGVNGDPLIHGAHTAKELRELLARSPEATAEKNIFLTSKLQSLKGYDPEVMKNIEVSLDPLNPTQLQITIDNLRTLRKKFPEVKIQARIRSLISRNPIVKAQMKKAIDITNELKIPTLETRLRWKRGSSASIFELDTKFYKKTGSGTLKLKKAAAKGAYQSSVCDDADSASCADCLNCFKGFGITPPKQTVFPK